MKDNKIVAGCIKGDEKCQKALFDRYYGMMLGIGVRYTKDESKAKDITQLALIKAYGNLNRFKGGSLAPWLRTITTNTFIDYYRKKKKLEFVSVGNLSSSVDYTTDVAEISVRRQLNSYAMNNLQDNGYEMTDEEEYIKLSTEKALGLLHRLSTQERIVFNLFIIDGYTHQDVADTLDISVSASKSALFGARQKIKRILSEEKEKLVVA